MNIPADKDLDAKARAANHETWRHIHRVQLYMNRLATRIMNRGHVHDQSKLVAPEATIFAEHTPFPAHITYGSPEYKEQLQKIKPALDHHYANNRHHPEFHPNGVDDMTVLDLAEMLADWKAAGERHGDGDIVKSIEINTERFGITDQLKRVLLNSIVELGEG